MRVPATPRPSPARGAQIAAAMRFPAADAGHPGHRPGAHDAARSARDAPAGGQRLLGGRPQFICFAGAPLVCPRPIRLKDARTCAAVRRSRLLGAAAQPSRRLFLPPPFGPRGRGVCRCGGGRGRGRRGRGGGGGGGGGWGGGGGAGPQPRLNPPGAPGPSLRPAPPPPRVWGGGGPAPGSLEDVHDDGCGPGAGGGGGIRTHERLAPLPVFKTGAMNRSATPPRRASVATSRAAGVVPASAIWHTPPP